MALLEKPARVEPEVLHIGLLLYFLLWLHSRILPPDHIHPGLELRTPNRRLRRLGVVGIDDRYIWFADGSVIPLIRGAALSAPTFCCGFECGAGHWSGGTYSTTTVRSGLRSLELTDAIGIASWWTNTQASIGRLYIRFSSFPGGDANFITWTGTGLAIRYRSSDTSLGTWNGSTFGSNVTISTGTWYRIDFKVISSANPHTLDVQIDGSALTQSTSAEAAANLTGHGATTSISSGVVFLDDYAHSVTSADYPIGAGYVKSYIPNADGSHNVAGANDFERSATGTDITNATTTAFQLIDDRPIKSGTVTEYINGIAPPNATDYVEWQYEDSTEPQAPRAVEAILTLSDAATAGGNDATITLRESAGATSANIFTGDIAAPAAGTAVFKRAHFAKVPGTSDPWTTTKFNALRSRFLVTDAAPDPWVASAMLEAEFEEVAAAEPRGKITIISQARQRAAVW